MGKKFTANLILVFIFLLCSFCYAANLTSITYDGVAHDYNVRDITLMLNNDKFEPKEGQMPPIILDNRTLVPVREVFEYLGGKVDWINSERRVDVTIDSTKISLWIDNKEAEVNGKKINLDVPAKIINDKTMVPVRFISEQANLVVNWDQETYTVDIKFQKAKITNVGFATVEGTNCVVITSNDKITGYKYFSLPKDENNNFRLVIDIENCDFTFNKTNASFESGMVAAIRFGDQGNGTNRIVIELRADTDYVVTMSKDRKKLYYAMAEEFTIPGETNANITEEKNDKDDNLSSTIPEENIPSGNTVEEKTAGETPVEEKPVEQKPAEEKPVEEKPVEEKPAEEKPTEETPVEEKPTEENPGVEDDTTNVFGDHDYESTEDEVVKYESSIDSIKYSTSTGRIKIKYSGTIHYDDMVLSNPNRIVIDIADSELNVSGPTEINVKNSIITGVRFSQYTKSSVRIVLDLDGKAEYNIYKRSSELQIEVKESTYKSIKYKKNTSNSQITLQNVQISDLSFDQDSKKFKYIITYNKKYDFGEGSLNPSDDFVNSIVVDDKTITILDTGDCKYAVRQSIDNVVITVRKNSDTNTTETTTTTTTTETDRTGKKVILIDVGHGGSDPGACNGDAQEKVYNLAIALKLYDKLKARDDIVVYIDRTNNDIYLNREDRVAYATKVDPDFIVSIHNNSLENKSYSGTMVLYYNNETESNYGDITSKECADIVLKELVSNLGTVSRGVVNRADLHILSKTACPSILCEVCFISNDAELEKLKTKSFQERAANAIYNGIESILKAM